MAKKNVTVENVTVENTTVENTVMENPFVLGAVAPTATSGRTIPGASELIAQCNAIALEAIKKATASPEVGQLAAAMQTGGMAELQAFVDSTCEVPSTEVISGCTDEELGRMLESRRSDRSKAKKAGLSSIDNIRRYVSAWIAELVIRQASGKAYKAPGTTELGQFESTDYEAITRKVKSLQSKKCRLSAVLKYGPNAAVEAEVAEIQAEIDRLNAMRGSKTRVKSTDSIKAMDLDSLRAAIGAMSDEEKAAIMAQLAG